MNMQDVIDYLYKIPRFSRTGGLSMTRKRLELLGNPEKTFKYVHVAGTNGKGSVCAYVEQGIRDLGFKTGLFTSPHLVKINERIQIGRENISDTAFMCAFDRVKKLVDAQAAEGIAHPTFFEFIFLMAMTAFAEAHIEYGIIETGLGGRLDLTNAVENPALTVITSIGLDHTEVLGATIEEIAGEKAGIIKPDTPLVYLDEKAAAASVLRKKAANVESIPVKPEWMVNIGTSGGQIHFSLRCPYFQKYDIILNTNAVYQIENSSLAVTVLETLRKRFPEEFCLTYEEFHKSVSESMEKMYWPGRMESIADGIYVDGAHNDDGILRLTQTLRSSFKDKQILLVFAVAEDKDYQQMVKHLCTLTNIKQIFVTEIGNTRRRDYHEVMDGFRKNTHVNIQGTYNVNEAIKAAVQLKTTEDVLICTGSLYLVGDVKKILGGI